MFIGGKIIQKSTKKKKHQNLHHKQLTPVDFSFVNLWHFILLHVFIYDILESPQDRERLKRRKKNGFAFCVLAKECRNLRVLKRLRIVNVIQNESNEKRKH